MKTKFLLFIACVSMLPIKQTISSEVFPTSDAIWVIQEYFFGINQYVYGMSGDTIINEKAYQKLYLLNDTTLTITHEDIFVAGIRQTEDKKIFIQPADKKDGTILEEFLMYDFGAEIGEKIFFGKNPYLGWGNVGPTFENVDMDWYKDAYGIIEDIFESNDKVHIVGNGLTYEIWIEGIGSLAGLFYAPLVFPTGRGLPQGGHLICMKKGDTINYLSDGCNSCFNTQPIFTSIEANEINNTVSVLYNSPNQTIDINYKDETGTFQFSLMKTDGRMVLTENTSHNYSNINVTGIPKGIYIYILSGNNTIQSGKLFIK